MKILIITKSFFPQLGPRSFRATELAKSLSANGNEVEVLTFFNKMHANFSAEYGVKITHFDSYLFSKPGKFLLKILNWILTKVNQSEKLNFPDSLIFFTILLNARKIVSANSIISIAKPHSLNWGIAYLRAKRKNQITRWIADCGDPFYNNPFRKYSSIFRPLDNLFYKKVDYVTVPVDISLTSYDSMYLDKFHVIPQGFDITKDLKFRESYVENSPVMFAYAGNFYRDKRDPQELIKYLRNSGKDFIFYIYTNSKWIRDYIPQDDKRFILSGFINRDILISKLSQLDFLISINNDGGVQSPSKLIDYAIAGRPILVLENNQVDVRLEQFLSKDFSAQTLVDLDLFDIHKISQKFIEIGNETN